MAICKEALAERQLEPEEERVKRAIEEKGKSGGNEALEEKSGGSEVLDHKLTLEVDGL